MTFERGRHVGSSTHQRCRTMVCMFSVEDFQTTISYRNKTVESVLVHQVIQLYIKSMS